MQDTLPQVSWCHSHGPHPLSAMWAHQHSSLLIPPLVQFKCCLGTAVTGVTMTAMPSIGNGWANVVDTATAGFMVNIVG